MSQSVEEIRKILVDEYDYSEEDALKIKGKKALQEALELEQMSITTDDMTSSEEVADQSQAVYPGDYGWHDFVMSQFHEEELYEGEYPTLKGLRRVGFNLLNGILESSIVELRSTLDSKEAGRASCVYKLLTGDGNVFYGAADAYAGNIQGGYHVYPVAIAENRAEARAYRKALMLNIVAAEEMSGAEKTEFNAASFLSGEYVEDDPISPVQIKAIQTKCKALNIDPDKFLSSVGYVEGKTTKKEGKEFLAKVNKFQQNMNSIPEEIKE
jgi:hypothetical protein